MTDCKEQAREVLLRANGYTAWLSDDIRTASFLPSALIEEIAMALAGEHEVGRLVERREGSIQTRVENFRTKYEPWWPTPHVRDSWLFCVTELSEIGDWLVRNGYALKDGYLRMNEGKLANKTALATEFGDLLVMLATLANQLGVDFHDAVSLTLEKIAAKMPNGFEEDPRI